MSKSHKNKLIMSFLSSIFGNSNTEKPSESRINWIPLTDLMQLEDIIVASNIQPVVIFKHSTRCSISRMVLKQLEREYDLDKMVKTFFLDLIAHRNISDEIAIRFEVHHESPQLLLIKNGKSIYNASHSDINTETLKIKI